MLFTLVGILAQAEEKLKYLNSSYQVFDHVKSDTPEVKLPFPITDYKDYTTKPNSRFDLALPENIQTEIKKQGM